MPQPKRKDLISVEPVQRRDHNLPEYGSGQVAGNTSKMPYDSEYK